MAPPPPPDWVLMRVWSVLWFASGAAKCRAQRSPPASRAGGNLSSGRAEPCRCASWNLPHRLGVADHALDRGRARAQGALQCIDFLVYLLDAEMRIDAAMEINDLAFVGFAYAHIMYRADGTAIGGEFGKRKFNRLHSLGRRLAAGSAMRLQWLDVGVDFHVGAEFGGDCVF